MLRELASDALGELEAAEPRHFDVGHQHVGPMGLRPAPVPAHRLRPRRRPRRRRPLPATREPPAHERVVVSQDHPDRAHRRPSERSVNELSPVSHVIHWIIDDQRCLINQTSATWQPRPLPPRPFSAYQVRSSAPVRVASRGMSNSSGFMSRGLSRVGMDLDRLVGHQPHLHLEHVAGVDDAQLVAGGRVEAG